MENSHTLRITGLAELPEPLEIDKDYLLSVNAGITGITKRTNEQGGFVYTYSAKQRTCEILKDNGQIIKAKVKGSPSKKLRQILWLVWDRSDKSVDEETFYIREMEKIQDNYKKYLE